MTYEYAYKETKFCFICNEKFTSYSSIRLDLCAKHTYEKHLEMNRFRKMFGHNNHKEWIEAWKQEQKEIYDNSRR